MRGFRKISKKKKEQEKEKEEGRSILFLILTGFFQQNLQVLIDYYPKRKQKHKLKVKY